MTLAVTFQIALANPDNWYEQNGQYHINWNYIDADCYMACSNEYPTADAFYNEFNSLCAIYLSVYAVDALKMRTQKEVDSVAA